MPNNNGVVLGLYYDGSYYLTSHLSYNYLLGMLNPGLAIQVKVWGDGIWGCDVKSFIWDYRHLPRLVDIVCEVEGVDTPESWFI